MQHAIRPLERIVRHALEPRRALLWQQNFDIPLPWDRLKVIDREDDGWASLPHD